MNNKSQRKRQILLIKYNEKNNSKHCFSININVVSNSIKNIQIHFKVEISHLLFKKSHLKMQNDRMEIKG